MEASWQSSGESYTGVQCCWNVDTHPQKTWKLPPQWLRDLITRCCFAQLVSPPLTKNDCLETQNDSVILAYRPAHAPTLWPEICENVSVWTVCARLICPLLPSVPLSLSCSLMQRVDWFQHSSVQLTSCCTWIGGWGVSIYLWVGAERYLQRILHD